MRFTFNPTSTIIMFLVITLMMVISSTSNQGRISVPTAVAYMAIAMYVAFDDGRRSR